MRTKKKNPKMTVKRLVSTVSKKREIAQDKRIKAMVMKMIKDDPKLHNKLKMQGSVSDIVNQLLPLGKEMVQHPEIVEEIIHNETMKKEFCKNPVVVTQLLQIPEVAETIVRKPSFIVDILQDGCKVKSLTKSLSKSSTPIKQEIKVEELIQMRNVITREVAKPTKVNYMFIALTFIISGLVSVAIEFKKEYDAEIKREEEVYNRLIKEISADRREELRQKKEMYWQQNRGENGEYLIEPYVGPLYKKAPYPYGFIMNPNPLKSDQ